MFLVPHRALPLATVPALTPRQSASPQPESAWAREWAAARQRVQPAPQPRHAGTARTGVVMQDGHPVMQDAHPVMQDAHPVVRTQQVAQGAGALGQDSTPLCAGDVGKAMSRVATPVLVRPGATPPDADTPEPLAALRRPSAPPAQKAPEAAVRVHIEQHAEGAFVWLALHGAHAAPTRRAAILAELTRGLAVALPRLAQVACNGTVHWRPQTGREDAWHSPR